MDYTVDVGSAAQVNWNATGHERIVQNVLNICRLFRYEATFARTMGMDSGILHRPVPEAQALLTAAIREQIELYEPRAKVKEVLFTGAGADGDMQFKVVIEI